MRDLVDARPPPLRRVALADCEQEQGGLRCLLIDVEDSPPTAIGLRDVVLHAASESRAVSRFCLAWTQRADRHPVSLQLPNGTFDRRACRLARAGEILRKGLLVNSQPEAGAPRRFADDYPSPSGGCISGPCSRQNFSDCLGVIARVPVRLRISSMEVALEGQSGAKISLTSAASSSVMESIW